MKKRSKKKNPWTPFYGANFELDGSVSFRVWGPHVKELKLKITQDGVSNLYPLLKDNDGIFQTNLPNLKPGTKYSYILDNIKERPDPCSKFQPEGVHKPSEIIDPKSFQWKDQKWKGFPLEDLILYEMHVGTFTPEGTFDAIISKLPYLKKLGITCIELMPVAQFPGKRNWGYDGVDLFAVQNSYGGPDGLKSLVQAAHKEGLAVCLDVVYNHFGPEGNYMQDFGPYFTDQHQTPWGKAVNYDAWGSKNVRQFVVDNALFWVTEYHVDALRLDAIQGVFDFSAVHILKELQEKVQEQAKKLGRKVHVIAESDLNDSKVVKPVSQGGYGLDAQWSDDFHHVLHKGLTGEEIGYYADFSFPEDLAKALQDTFVYDGRYSKFRNRNHGNSVKEIPGKHFVICSQNHDQIGNRAFGDRLSKSISFDQQKCSAVLLLLAPYLPLLFMGQEYSEKNPFQYFVDHSDPTLLENVRRGRKAEFASFGWKKIPDCSLEETFHLSKLNWSLQNETENKSILKLYEALLALRKTKKILKRIKKSELKVYFNTEEQWLGFEYLTKKGSKLAVLYSYSKEKSTIKIPFKSKSLKPILSTDQVQYGGSNELKHKVSKNHITLEAQSAIVGTS